MQITSLFSAADKMSLYGSQVSTSSHRGQYISCRVCMLDDVEYAFDLPVSAGLVAFFGAIIEGLIRSWHHGIEKYSN
jgi:hypothetical protein